MKFAISTKNEVLKFGEVRSSSSPKSLFATQEEGTVLGLGFHIPKDNSTMSVKFIQEGGLAEAFNQKNPDLAFKPGDRVLIVNEATEPAKVKKQLKNSTTFNLTLERP